MSDTDELLLDAAATLLKHELKEYPLETKLERFMVGDLQGIRILFAGEITHRIANTLITQMQTAGFDVVEVYHVAMLIAGPFLHELYSSYPTGLVYQHHQPQINDYFPGFGASCPVKPQSV